MTGEQVPAQSLEAGDVIRIQHQHNSQCGQCLSHWEAYAVVTEDPARAGRGLAIKWAGLAIKWAGDTRLPGSTPAVTGISVVWPDEPALRIGQLPAKGTHHRG
jgi:hypothetical protein